MSINSAQNLISKPISEKDRVRLDGFFERIKSQYPVPESCAMPLLYAVQQIQGFISKEGLEYVSEKTRLTPAHVLELATFYTMFRLKPVGQYHIQICRTASCYFCGGRELIEFVRDFVGKDEFDPSDDGLFSWELVECIGSCGSAPAVIINDRLFENLNVDQLKDILDRIKLERPNLSLDVFSDRFGDDWNDLPFSRILDSQTKR